MIDKKTRKTDHQLIFFNKFYTKVEPSMLSPSVGWLKSPGPKCKLGSQLLFLKKKLWFPFYFTYFYLNYYDCFLLYSQNLFPSIKTWNKLNLSFVLLETHFYSYIKGLFKIIYLL